MYRGENFFIPQVPAAEADATSMKEPETLTQDNSDEEDVLLGDQKIAESPENVSPEYIQRRKNFEKVQKKVVGFYESQGIITRDAQQRPIIDLEAFQDIETLRKLNTTTNFFKKQKNVIGGMSSRHKLFEALVDMPVISKEDYERGLATGNFTLKPLFSLPKSIDEAFDVNALDNDNAYLKYWDVSMTKESLQEDVLLPSGEKLPIKEYNIFYTLFHTLQARREMSGDLTVQESKTGDRHRLSVSVFRDGRRSSSVLERNDLPVVKNNAEFFQNIPHLLERGIIHLDDFNIDAKDDVHRKEYFLKPGVSQVSIDGMQYYSGKTAFSFQENKIPLEEVKFTILDDKNVGVFQITNGQERLLYVLQLFSSEEKAKKYDEVRERTGLTTLKQIIPRCFIGKKERDAKMKEWDVTESNPPKTGESHREYAKRILFVSDWQNIKTISQEFSKKAHIGIHNLSWREQQWLCGAMYKETAQKDDFFAFGKQFGLSGLRTFLSIEQGGPEIGEKILDIAENIPADTASKIFAKYSEMVDASDASYEYLVRNSSDRLDTEERTSLARKLSEKLLEQGKNLLLDFSESQTSDTEALLKKLDHIKADTELFREFFRTMYQSSDHFDIAELKNIEFKTISGVDFSQEEQDAMRAIYRANYQSPEYPESFQHKLLESLDASFSDPESTFYTLKKDDRIIAYNRFTPIDTNHTSFGAFNVDHSLSGAKIGEALLKLSLETEVSKGKVITAACDSRKPVSSFYLKNGFVANGFEEMDNVPAFTIERNPFAQYATKDIPIESIKDFPDDTVKIRKFLRDEPLDDSLFEEGYVLTQYLIHSKTQDKYCVFEKRDDTSDSLI